MDVKERIQRGRTRVNGVQSGRVRVRSCNGSPEEGNPVRVKRKNQSSREVFRESSNYVKKNYELSVNHPKCLRVTVNVSN